MNPSTILVSAKQFFRAYELCFGVGLPADINNTVEIPAIVNLVFAIELCLKACVCTYKAAPRIHKLLDLYQALPHADQQFLRVKLGMDELTLISELAKVSNAFTEWRYSHEHRALVVNLKFLLAFWLSAKVLGDQKETLYLQSIR